MSIVLENNSIIGAATISADGSNYGITQTVLGHVNFPYRPSFYAYGISGSTFAVGNYMIFPTTEVNVGGHYNTANGRFTAPITGIYQFHWSNIANNTSGVYRYYFRINGSNIGDIHLRQDNSPTGAAYGNNGAYCITYPLSVNDYVQIFYSAGPTSTYPGTNSAVDDYINFSGWLIG